jgi:hypothetical protein
MAKSPAISVELAIALPLGVVANQLLKIEVDLRFLGAKASVHAPDRENADLAAQIAARLEQINETLEAIRGLIADMETEMQPRAGRAASRDARKDRDD